MAVAFKKVYKLCCGIVFFKIVLTEGRVLCHDSHATPWKPLGFSCPINCYNVRYAAEKLKLSDYKKVLAQNLMDREKEKDVMMLGSNPNLNVTGKDVAVVTNVDTRKAFNFGNSKYDKYKEFTILLQNNVVLADVQAKIDSMAAYSSDNKCGVLLKRASLKPHLLTNILADCSRRSNVEVEFLTELTSILNKHSKKIKFNLDMTKILLQRILGSSIDLRNGITDIRLVLARLQQAVATSLLEPKNHAPLTMRLRSTHCLSAFVVGCFCQRGYVERSGRCVEPSQCIKDKSYLQYLARITVY